MLDIILWSSKFNGCTAVCLGDVLVWVFSSATPQVPHLQYWQRLPVFPGLHLLAKFTFCQSMSKTSSILLLLETPFSRLLHVFFTLFWYVRCSFIGLFPFTLPWWLSKKTLKSAASLGFLRLLLTSLCLLKVKRRFVALTGNGETKTDMKASTCTIKIQVIYTLEGLAH